MLDFRRFERGFFLSLVVIASLIGATRLVLHMTTPDLQVIVAAESTSEEELAEDLQTVRQSGHALPAPDLTPSPGDVAGLGAQAANGSILVALLPRPTSQFGMLPYYLGVGWGRVALGWEASDRPDQTTVGTGGPERPEPAEPGNASAVTADGRININLATAEELQTLPGIGPALASRILEMREYRGGFVYPDELLDVSGIGPARYEQLADRITVGPLDP